MKDLAIITLVIILAILPFPLIFWAILHFGEKEEVILFALFIIFSLVVYNLDLFFSKDKD
jgi:integral membrane sensor domain MASE1